MFSLEPRLALLQSIFVVFMITAIVVHDIVHLPRLKRHTSTSSRLSAYKKGMMGLWLLALAALALAGPHSLLRLSADAAGLLDSPLLSGTATLALAVYFCIAFAPALHCMARPAARAIYAKATASLHFILPVSARERRWWIVLSMTAGMCEEIVFRGFLPQFIQGRLHGGW